MVRAWLAGVFAWISSWGTLVMERVALWLGGSTMAVIPWKDGVTGAVLIVAVEIGIGMLLVFVSRCLQHVRRYEPECLACASVPLGMSASVSGARRRDVSYAAASRIANAVFGAATIAIASRTYAIGRAA